MTNKQNKENPTAFNRENKDNPNDPKNSRTQQPTNRGLEDFEKHENIQNYPHDEDNFDDELEDNPPSPNPRKG